MSQELFTVHLVGIIRTESPFASSPPPAFGSRKKGPAMLPRLPVYRDGQFVEMPVISAGSIKGKLRRAASDLLAARFAAGGLKPNMRDWLLWTVGGIKEGAEKSSGESIDIRERRAARQNSALLNVFGAGAGPGGGMLGGRMSVDPAVPAHEVQTAVVRGVRRGEHLNDDLVEILDPEGLADVLDYTRDRYAKTARDRKTAKKQRGAAGETVIEAEEEDDGGVSITLPLPGYEVIPAGVEMTHRITLKGCPLEHVGFVVAALVRFAEDPVLGAHVASGCGRISGGYQVTVRKVGDRAFEDGGQFSFGDGGVTFSGFLTDALDAWEAAPFSPDAYRAGA